MCNAHFLRAEGPRAAHCHQRRLVRWTVTRQCEDDLQRRSNHVEHCRTLDQFGPLKVI